MSAPDIARSQAHAEFKRREKLRDRLGLWGTIAIAAFAIWRFMFQSATAAPLTLNEWGDALAGFFAPAAFLWLILGYKQQADELQQNTLALQMQEKEMHDQVSETRQLVEATLKMADANLKHAEAAQAAIAQARERAKPRLVLLEASGNNVEPPPAIFLKFRNVGGPATFIGGQVRPGTMVARLQHLNRDAEDFVCVEKLEMKNIHLLRLRFEAIDELGQNHTLRYAIQETFNGSGIQELRPMSDHEFEHF